MDNSHAFNIDGKTPPLQRARHNELLEQWKRSEREKKYQSQHESRIQMRKSAVESVLYAFTPEKVPMGSSLIRGKMLDKDGLFGMIVTLNIDSYFLDCLQIIKEFADGLKNPVLFSDEIFEKILKVGRELGVEIDATSLESNDNLIDDFLDALILKRNSNSPNKMTDLYTEFDIYLTRYFGEMSSVRINSALNELSTQLWSFVPIDYDKVQGMMMAGKSVEALKAKNEMGYAGLDLARMQVLAILGERIARREPEAETAES